MFLAAFVPSFPPDTSTVGSLCFLSSQETLAHSKRDSASIRTRYGVWLRHSWQRQPCSLDARISAVTSPSWSPAHFYSDQNGISSYEIPQATLVLTYFFKKSFLKEIKVSF